MSDCLTIGGNSTSENSNTIDQRPALTGGAFPIPPAVPETVNPASTENAPNAVQRRTRPYNGVLPFWYVITLFCQNALVRNPAALYRQAPESRKAPAGAVMGDASRGRPAPAIRSDSVSLAYFGPLLRKVQAAAAPRSAFCASGQAVPIFLSAPFLRPRLTAPKNFSALSATFFAETY